MINETFQIQYHSLEEAIHSVYGNDAKKIKTEHVHGGDINDACRISLSIGETVFVKTNSIRNLNFFITEAHGLTALKATGTIGIPKVLGIGIDEQKGFSFLLLEWIESIPRIRNYWETFGYELANLHRAALFRAEEPQTDKYRHSYFRGTDGQPLLRYGFEEDNFIGANPQKNCPMASWIDFYRECRLTPQIKMAEHYLDSQLQRKITYLLDHLDSYLREPEFPSLLHGDLWSGNVLCGPDGKAWILDPAAYVGDFETDLAMTQLFGSFPSPFYSAYQEINPIDKGYEERKDLYHLYHLLNHLNLFGRSYLGSVAEILNGYI
ncbi:MAG: fructosamine kinase family protein [Lachnospiraceae bacterium]|jgi:fructosamine-3-kinase|nr:fructosamine kinase family protein [Lachnospiraceae bacterium]